MGDQIVDGFGKTGTYMKVNTDGSLCTTAINDFLFDIPGGNSGNDFVYIMRGRNPDIDTGQTADIGDLGGTFNLQTTAAALFASSTNVGDDQLVLVRGLDSDYNIQIGAVTLNGQNKVEIQSLLGQSITFIRFFEAINADSTDFAGEIYIYEDDTVTGGIPDTPSKRYGKILIGPSGISNNRTFNAFFTVPDGFDGYFRFVTFSMGRGKDGTIETLARSENGTFVTGISLDVFENYNVDEINPPLFVPERTDIKAKLTSNNDNTSSTFFAQIVLLEQ